MRCRFVVAHGGCFAVVLRAKRVLVAGLSTSANRARWCGGTAGQACLPPLGLGLCAELCFHPSALKRPAWSAW